MLQRQIMFKQLQELQRRQQLQELGGASNHDYVDQLMSSKQPSAVQLSPTVNRTPIRDSRMLMFDNMQMAQQSESSIFQGFPSGLVLSQGLSPPQFDMSIYDNHSPNADRDLNQYPYPQDPSNFSANLSTKSNNSPLGMSPVHPSAIASSFMTHQGSFSADQSIVSDGSLLSCQVFQEKNLFGQVPFSSNSNFLPVNYSPQGITTQGSTSEGRLEVEDTGWPGYSPGEVLKADMTEASVTLDLMEQKILYSSNDRGWLSSFGANGKKGAEDFECTVENPSFADTLPSIQSGSWSALMQSAVTETSSSDTVVQEEWSELSFQNPEPSSDNQPSNLSNGENLQDNWIDRNLQNVSSPSSEPEQLFPRPDMKCSFPCFQQSGKQFRKQKDEFQCESSHISGQCLTDCNSQLKHPTGRNQLVQNSLPSEHPRTAYKENSKTGHELHDTLWSSNPVSGGFQTPFGQLNQPNFHRYPVESEKMDPGDNVDPLSAHLGASDLYSQNAAAQSILPNSQEFGIRSGPADSVTPQSYSHFPSSPMENLNVRSLPNSYEKDYIKNQHLTPSLPSYMLQSRINASSSGPRFSLLKNVAVAQPSGTSVSSQRVGFPTGLPPPRPDVTAQQDTTSPRANKFSSSLFRTPGSASSNLETTSRAQEQSSLDWSKHRYNVGYDEQKKASFLPESSTEIHNPTTLSSNTDSQVSLRKYSEVDGVASGSYIRHTSPLPSDQVEQKDIESPHFSVSESRAFGHPLLKNFSLLHQFNRPRDGRTDSGKRFPFNYQPETTNSRELLLSGQSFAVKDKAGAFSPGNVKGNFTKEAADQPAKASLTDYLRSSQQMEMLCQNESQSHSIDKEASNVAYHQSQISLQMAPSWFKHYGNLKSSEAVPSYNQKAATTAMPPFSGLSIANLPESRLNMQVDSAHASQGSGTWPSSAATLIASKHSSPPSMLPSDVDNQHLSVTKLGKRKIVEFDLEPWHKEVNSEAPRPQNISTAEFEWAQALNRRQEEAINEAEIVHVHPVIRAKRRLTFTTQLMQQIFRPSVEDILFGDASSNCDYLVYSAARTTLGDACNLNIKMPSDSNDVSPDKLKTSKRTTSSDFSKIAECLISRAEKLEGDLSRLDRSTSVVDIKVESQELEKFSTLNRFAKFHFKAHIDPASSSGPSTVQKTTPQRYVTASPMPKILPEDRECISL